MRLTGGLCIGSALGDVFVEDDSTVLCVGLWPTGLRGDRAGKFKGVIILRQVC